MARARGGRSGRLATEDPRSRAAAQVRESKGQRGKLITGLILFVIGLVALLMLWDIASSIFEKQGPLPIDLAEFESLGEVNIHKFLEGKHEGYSRYVTIRNAEAAPFNSVILDSGGRKVKDYAYLLTAPGSKLHSEYEKKSELLVGTEDQNKTTVEKIVVDPPTMKNYRVIVITTNGKPRERRVDETLFWAGPTDFQGSNATGFTGVIRPINWVSDDDIRTILQSKGFSGMQHDRENYMYVLYLSTDTRGLPPEEGTAYICLVVPILFMLGGLTLAFLAMKDPVRGSGGGRAPAGGGSKRGGGSRRGRAVEEDYDEEPEGEVLDAPPPVSKRPSARGSARKSGTGSARKSGTGGSARKSSRRGR